MIFFIEKSIVNVELQSRISVISRVDNSSD